jgi:hypothetical protein
MHLFGRRRVIKEKTMKRLAVVLAAATVLAVGSAASAFAAPSFADQTPQLGWNCPGWAGVSGTYDPTTNPTIKQMADKLGIGADALVNELKGGKSVADVAAAQNVDLQALVDTLMAPQNDLMATRVKYGYLTQDQANQALQNMSTAIKNELQVKGFFGGFGPGMMGGGFGPGMMGGGFGRGIMGGGYGGMMGGGWGGPRQ